MAWPRFIDRAEGGRELAKALSNYADRSGTIVLGLPRGGIPVGLEVAQDLRMTFEPLLVRELRVPGNPGTAVGILARKSLRILNRDIIDLTGAAKEALSFAVSDGIRELDRNAQAWEIQDDYLSDYQGKTVILVDEALHSNSCAASAIELLRQRGCVRIVAAAPVGMRSYCEEILTRADEVVCLELPEPFIGAYRHFQHYPPLEDEHLRQYIQQRR